MYAKVVDLSKNEVKKSFFVTKDEMRKIVFFNEIKVNIVSFLLF